MSLQGASVEVIVTKGSFPTDQQFLRPCRVKISQSDNTLLLARIYACRSMVHLGEECVMFHKRSGHRVLHPRTMVGALFKPRLKDSMRFQNNSSATKS